MSKSYYHGDSVEFRRGSLSPSTARPSMCEYLCHAKYGGARHMCHRRAKKLMVLPALAGYAECLARLCHYHAQGAILEWRAYEIKGTTLQEEFGGKE